MIPEEEAVRRALEDQAVKGACDCAECARDLVEALGRLGFEIVEKGSRVCPGGDPTCPCQDGDLCHYEGPDAWPIPFAKKGLIHPDGAP